MNEARAVYVTVTTAEPISDPPIVLTDRERELILILRQLQLQRKYCKLTAEFENGSMRFGVWQPITKWV